MFLSDDFSHLDQLLKDAGASGSAVRVHLVRRFSELIQQLSSRLETDLQSSSSVAEAPVPELDSDSGSSPPGSLMGTGDFRDLRKECIVAVSGCPSAIRKGFKMSQLDL